MAVDQYDLVAPLSEEEFEEARPTDAELADDQRFTKSDAADIAKMERLLDVSDGTLADDDYYLERGTCDCGHLLTMYDFVFTGLVDAGHSKSLILHTFVGSKYVLNPARPLRCSVCGAKQIKPNYAYAMAKYGCRMPE